MKNINLDKNLCCDDVIKFIFDLNSLDIKVFNKLKEENEIRADTLAKQLRRERSTVYRSLQKLTFAGLCSKKTKKIESGGYYHVYSLNNIHKTKEKLDQCIEDWYQKMKQTIEEIN